MYMQTVRTVSLFVSSFPPPISFDLGFQKGITIIKLDCNSLHCCFYHGNRQEGTGCFLEQEALMTLILDIVLFS